MGPTPAGIHTTPDDHYLQVGIMGAGYVEVIDGRARRTTKLGRVLEGPGRPCFR